jgi:Putative esterase
MPKSVLLAIVAALVAVTPPSTRAADRRARDLRIVTFTSERLSGFWGFPVEMKAAAYVPPRCAQVRCAVLYHLPGYGGSVAHAWPTLREFARLSTHVPKLAMAHVFIDPSFNGGYSYFTDSANNGPWDSALVQEFIPYLEETLEVGGTPGARFLVGHSSGGWTVMWLQVSNPGFFRAVWAISPDPLDFRHFYQVDATPGSTDDFYTRPDGRPRYLERDHAITMRRLMQHVDDDPARGGIISSYEFAWSPRGSDGLPTRLFDRDDGTLVPETLDAWQVFDIRSVLGAGGVAMRATLADKINVYCGTQDDFFYDQPTRSMCDFLRQNDYRAVCRLVPGRTHTSVLSPSSLYPLGLRHLVLDRAAGIWRRESGMPDGAPEGP